MTTQKKDPHASDGSFKKRSFKANSSDAQRQRLLAAMKKHKGGITTLFARRVLDIMHPGGRILELRKSGYNILTHWTVEETDCGDPHRVARYVLLSSPHGGRNE